MQQRDQANVENRTLRRQDWMDRCFQAHLSIGNKYGKGYREPMVRHAFYAPTKLHYYPEGSYSQFDRKMPSVSPPPWTFQVQGSSLVPFAPSTRASAAQI